MLNEKIAVITGASRGIGAAIAKKMAENGATVIINYQGSVQAAQALEAEIREKGGKAVTYKCDVSDFDKCEKFIGDIVKEYGRIDILVNNAGITYKCRAEEFPADRYQRIQNLNLETVFELCKMCYPYLKQSQHIGRIVSISSMGAHMGFSGVVPYCMTKSGVTGLTRGLAEEWKNDNILVNSVAPGWVLTRMNEEMFRENPDRKEAALRKMMLDRFAAPSDIGRMILFLLGKASSYCTGQDFAVDGGALAHGF